MNYAEMLKQALDYPDTSLGLALQVATTDHFDTDLQEVKVKITFNAGAEISYFTGNADVVVDPPNVSMVLPATVDTGLLLEILSERFLNVTDIPPLLASAKRKVVPQRCGSRLMHIMVPSVKWYLSDNDLDRFADSFVTEMAANDRVFVHSNVVAALSDLRQQERVKTSLIESILNCDGLTRHLLAETPEGDIVMAVWIPGDVRTAGVLRIGQKGQPIDLASATMLLQAFGITNLMPRLPSDWRPVIKKLQDVLQKEALHD